MRVDVSSDGVRVGESLSRYIDRRVSFTLGRFGPAIDRVDVRVGDVNGPRGGVDKRCQVIVRLRASGSRAIAVDSRDDNLYATVARACDRAGRAVARALDRRRQNKAYKRRRALVQDAS